MRVSGPHIVRSTGKRSESNNRGLSAAKPPDRSYSYKIRLQRRESVSPWSEGLPALTLPLSPCRHFRLYITPMMVATLGYKKKTPKYLLLRRLHLIEGGYLLSHFRTTIGVTGFNFSVRNGKRWNPRAITTLVSSVKEIYSLMPSAFVGFPRRIRLEKEFLEATSFAQCIIHNA